MTALINFDVCLADDIFVLFPRREVERIQLISGMFLVFRKFPVDRYRLALLDVITGFKICVTGIENLHIIEDTTVFDFPIRRFDEAELIDPGKARERRDQSDVRTFRRLDRADASVMCW